MKFIQAFFLLFLICCFAIVPGVVLLGVQSRTPEDDRRSTQVYGGLFLSFAGLAVFFVGIIALLMYYTRPSY